MVSPLSDPRHKFCDVYHFISPSVISSVGIVNCEERKEKNNFEVRLIALFLFLFLSTYYFLL